MKRAFLPLLAVALVAAGAAGAQTVNDVLNAGDRRVRLAQSSQEKVDAVVEDTRALVDDYNRVTKEIQGLEVYNALMERQVTDQNEELQRLADSIDQVTVIERQIMPLDLPGDLIEPAYLALKRLYRILYDPELRLTLELGAGEGLIFDNQRILHGRTGFTPEEPARSVLTSSVDIEEFHSSLRLLQANVRGVVSATRMRQGMVA